MKTNGFNYKNLNYYKYFPFKNYFKTMFLLKFFKGFNKSNRKRNPAQSPPKTPPENPINCPFTSLLNIDEMINENSFKIENNPVLEQHQELPLIIDNKGRNDKILGKLLQKPKALSNLDINNPEKGRNKARKLTIEPLKVKVRFREKELKKPQKGIFINKSLKKPELLKETTVFDKIDKILAKSTAYEEKNKKNYEKDLIKIINKNVKSKNQQPIKKSNNLKRFYGENVLKSRILPKPKLKPIEPEDKKPNNNNKSAINHNNSSLDCYFEENSMRLMEWNEANSLQDIKNMNISELNYVFLILILKISHIIKENKIRRENNAR